MSGHKWHKSKSQLPALASRQRTQNTVLRGLGGETLQDRSAHNTAAQYTLHPYYNNNFLARWQEYTRWYMTSWEARKLVDIPVQDALREKVELRGLQENDERLIWDAYEKFDVERQLRRALIQERLLGGCVIVPIFLRSENEKTDDPLNFYTLQKGDLQAFNVVDVGRLSRAEYNTDPFSPYFDKIERIQVNATIVHTSRLVVLDSDPLFNFTSQRIMENYRFNPVGFGESVLSTLYDTLIRATGTQQGAYHLVNLSSCLIVACAQLRTLNAVGSPAQAKLEEIAEQISIYRAAVIDGKDVEFKQHTSTFGSVPELVMSFLQILSAGSDIPATRFLGQAPGGLNATGESDLENYYNHIAAWQRMRLEPRQRRIFDWLGAHIFGAIEWKEKSMDLELEYPPLWNLDKVQQSQVDNTYATIISTLIDGGIIDEESGRNELKERGIFLTDVKPGDMLGKEADGAVSPFGEGGFGGDREGEPQKKIGNSVFSFANAEFKESEHKRDEGGKFSATGDDGGKAEQEKSKTKEEPEEPTDKHAHRSGLAKEYYAKDNKADEQFKKYESLQEEYITKLGSAKRGEKGKLKKEYEPKVEEALQEWGRTKRDAQAAYSSLVDDIEKGWGGKASATVQAKDWQQFLKSEIDRYIKTSNARRLLNADFDESEIKRDEDGKFGEGGGITTTAEEKQRKIDSVNIDFTKDNTLPGLNKEDLEKLESSDKPVLLKKNIIDRNRKSHADINPEEYNAIIGQSLYDHDAIIPSKKPDKPNYYNFIKYLDKDHSVVLLEVSPGKEHHEIVHILKMNDRGIRRL